MSQAYYRLYEEQWKAGKKQDAQATLTEAFGIVDHYATPKPATSQIDYAALFGQSGGVWAWQAARHLPRLYNELISVAISVGDESSGPVILEKIRELSSMAKTKDEKEGILTELAIGEARIGHFKMAEQTARKPHADMGRDDAWDEIAREKAIRNDLPGALAAFRHVRPQDEFGRSMVASDLTKLGKFDDALAIIKTISSAAGRADALVDLGSAQAEKGDSRAKQTLDSASQLLPSARVTQEAQSYGTFYPLDGIETAITAARVRLGQLPRSVEPDIRQRVALLVYDGHKDEALALARKEENPEKRLNAILSIAQEILRLAR